MNYINKRVLEEANYIIQTGKTVREIASLFKVLSDIDDFIFSASSSASVSSIS